MDNNTIKAEKNVVIENKQEKYVIYSDFISYLKDEEKIYTIGKTKALFKPKYKIVSEDVIFLKNSMELLSDKKTTLEDGDNYYKFDKFLYSIDNEEIKGEKILISSNHKLINNDKFYFSSGIINLKTKNFIAKDTKINIHKNIFNEPQNDPRLYGTSSIKKGSKTIVKKAVFTNCKKTDNCPPWSMEAEEITHNSDKKQ